MFLLLVDINKAFCLFIMFLFYAAVINAVQTSDNRILAGFASKYYTYVYIL